MKLNKKYLYLGVSLFSAVILTPLAAQTVKADTTSTQSVASTTTAPITTTNALSTATKVTMPTTSTSADTSTASTNTTTTKPVSTTDSTTNNPTTSNSISNPVVATTSAMASTTSKTAAVAPNTTTVSAPVSKTATSVTPTSTTTPETATPATTSTVNTTATVTINNSANTLPSNLPDDTVVNFTDPLLGAVIKQQLNLQPTDTLTVGQLRKFNGRYFNASEISYLVGQTHTAMTDQQSTPIESLNGMQYLQALPASTSIDFQAKIASDAKADPDLTPLDNLNLTSLDITGNFSNPNAKEINVNQLPALNITNASTVDLNGDLSLGYGSGITNQQLKTISPWLVKYANSTVNTTANIDSIQFSNSNLTDFTPLKGLETGIKMNIIADTPVHLDKTPIFAVDNEPITFTAPPVLGLDGDNLATGYHFSNSVPQEYLTEEDLTNLGNGNYRLDHPTPNAQVLAYGYLGFGYSSNPNNYVNKTYGNVALQYYILNGQPILWQTSPAIAVNYLSVDGTSVTVEGKKLDQIIRGNKIGDPYDLTSISQVPGYQLVSPETLLKGNFTQTPHVINLIYTPIESEPIIPETPDNSTSSHTNHTHHYETQVQVYDKDGQAIANHYVGVKNEIILASIRKNGQTFYQIGTKQWVLANDFYISKSTQKDVRTFASDIVLVDRDGKVISISIAPNSEWRVLKTVILNNQKYYEIAKNEFILASDTVEFTPLKAGSKVHLTRATFSYNSRGQTLKTNLARGSNWYTDGYAVINGQKMYRIATDEWANATVSKIQ